MKHLLFVPAFALLAAMALVGCSDDNGETDPRIPATSVVVDVTEQELHVGETLQLTATPTPANTTDKVQDIGRSGHGDGLRDGSRDGRGARFDLRQGRLR